jgi:UvrD/REP helicase N-terminal domain
MPLHEVHGASHISGPTAVDSSCLRSASRRQVPRNGPPDIDAPGGIIAPFNTSNPIGVILVAWDEDLDKNGVAYKIAAATGKRIRVIAGPGTGKSYAMKRRVARLLEEEVKPEKVLAFTFARVAAEDLTPRVAKARRAGLRGPGRADTTQPRHAHTSTAACPEGDGSHAARPGGLQVSMVAGARNRPTHNIPTITFTVRAGGKKP